MATLSDKYVVIKSEDYAGYLLWLHDQGLHDASLEAQTLPITGEYFVVRDQDIWAPAGLFAYAANIRTSIEFTETAGVSIVSDDVRDAQMELADDLVVTADRWQHQHKTKQVPAKLPD